MSSGRPAWFAVVFHVVGANWYAPWYRPEALTTP